MTKSALGFLLVLLLGGCAESARETRNEKAATANVTAAPEAGTASPVDAKTLLASTLERANADNKRVLVHLGSPW